MPPSGLEQPLHALGDYLATRRPAILLAWRKATRADPAQTTARSLTRGQFEDHIPQVLDAFENKLRAPAGGADARAADRTTKQEEMKHGLHRWQQGYRLQELMLEWGHLQLCLFAELQAFVAAHPSFGPEVFAAATGQMIKLVNEAISRSAGQYELMQQAEAASHIGDLTAALASVRALERSRSTLIHQAVHDLGSNVLAVSAAAHLLGVDEIAVDQRKEFASLLQLGVHSVAEMLGELRELARLEAGQEHRDIARFDAAALISEQCKANQPLASERGLFLKIDGPPRLAIDGDAVKVRRMLQNLLRNALKYTVQGGVTVSWGAERENWWLMVKDTGPGLLAGDGTALIVGLKAATASARESDEITAETKGEASQVLTPPGGSSLSEPTSPSQPGEGIGLSIVKRLCELLDASLEVSSSPKSGTTFRIVLPRDYSSPPGTVDLAAGR